MAEQKQDGRSKKSGDKKKQEQAPKPRRKTNWTLARKAKNVQCHLARDAKRAEKAGEASTPRGTARLERRRLTRLAAVEQAAQEYDARQEVEAESEELGAEQAPQPVNEGYAPTPLGAQLAAMDREAKKAGLWYGLEE
jgi:hypothetical protein